MTINLTMILPDIQVCTTHNPSNQDWQNIFKTFNYYTQKFKKNPLNETKVKLNYNL